MRFTVNPLKYKIPATPECTALFVRGTIKVQDIVHLYSYVVKNSIEEFIEQKHVIGKLTINYRLIGKEILIESANYETSNRYDFYFKPSLHFMARMIERSFDLNILVVMYQYILKNNINDSQEIEISSDSSIIFVKYNNVIKLVSGWPGDRYAS